MKRLARWVGLLVLAAVSAWGSLGQAQPTIPKRQIPSDIPAEVRQRIEGLYSADPRQRATAARRLVGKPEDVAPAIPFLIAMLHDEAVLHDEAELMRLSLISSIGTVFSYPNTPGEQAAETLARIGRRAPKPVVDALIPPLKDKDWTVRANAVRALGEMLREMGREEREIAKAGRALEPLIVALDEQHAKLREYAAVVLGQLANPRAVEPLIATLEEDESGAVRKAAAAALGAVTDPRPVGPLIAVLENPVELVEVRTNAAEALGSIGGLQAVGSLTKALKDKDWRIRSAALRVADLIRDFRVLRPLLIDALQDEHWRVRVRAALASAALGKLKDPAALKLLTIALHDKQPNVRAAATGSLAELNDLGAVVPLIVALREDQNSYVRWHAARALEQLADPRAVGPLTAALKDENELVRTSARRALEKIKKALQTRTI